MNKVETLAAMFGAKNKLARICEVDNSSVSHWVTSGRIPVRYNHRLKAEIASADKPDEWKAEAVACLEEDNCPTCGQSLNGRIL